MTPGHRSLGVTWSIPNSINTKDIVAFDIRHIESSASDKADSNWTVTEDYPNARSAAILSGLSDGVQYDVQVRADLGTDGPWSPTSTGTPAGPGDSVATAVEFVHNVGVIGHLGSSSDNDYYTFTLTETSEVFLFTSGLLSSDGSFTDGTIDPQGKLYVDTNNNNQLRLIGSYDQSRLTHGYDHIYIAETLPPGKYYLAISISTAGNPLLPPGVAKSRNPSGVYTMFFRAFRESTDRASARPVRLDTPYDAQMTQMTATSTSRRPFADRDYFKFVLNEDTDVHIYNRGRFDSNLELLNEQGSRIAFNDDGLACISPRCGETDSEIVARLSKGTYYAVLTSRHQVSGGIYRFRVDTVENDNNTVATASVLERDKTVTAAVSSTVPENYFKFDVTFRSFIRLDVLNNDKIKPDLQIQVLDSNQNLQSSITEVITNEDFKYLNRPNPDLAFHSDYSDRLFSYQGMLPGGPAKNTLYVKVTSTGTTGPYAIRLRVYRDLPRIHNSCFGKDRRRDAPADQYYACQWHLYNGHGLFSGANQDIDVEPVWSAGVSGAGITVGVVDTGMNTKHEDLKDNIDNDRNINLRTGTRNIFNPFEDHGTAVAGVIAATHNNIGVRGVAPQAKVFGVNLLDEAPFSVSTVVSALVANSTSTAVYNHSWGRSNVNRYKDVNAAIDLAYQSIIENGFYGKGSSLIFAAGNGHSGNSSNTNEYITHVATTPVCAFDYGDRRSYYSLVGSNLWICAPSGGSSLTGILTTRAAKEYNRFSGTSAAAPIVSGVTALIRSAHPHLTWRDVKLILAGSARKLDSANDACNITLSWQETGLRYGSTTDRYQFSHCYGFGAVNARAALELADSWSPLPQMETATAADDFQDVLLKDNSSTYSTHRVDDIDVTELYRVRACQRRLRSSVRG